jgi:glycosyltransferase involved in cell wall biosynthesis
VRLAVNGRYRGRPITGVERYAHEIVRRLPGPPELIAPGRPLGSAQGHLWEQAVLPIRARGRWLWSPCSTGPIRHARQVVTLHDTAFVDFPQDFSPAFRRWYDWLWRRLASRVAMVLTVSEFSKGRIVEQYGVSPERVTVIPNGVSAAFFDAPEPDERAPGEPDGGSRPYVLSVSSLTPRKNMPGLIEAWRRASERLPDHELRVVGGAAGHFRSSGLAAAPRVRLLGRVSDARLRGLYAGADAFVYLSKYEGFGLPVLEAMASGTPVIHADTTALPEAAGRAGLAVSPEEPGAAADAMVAAVLDATTRQRLIEDGRAHARRFSWDRTASMFVEATRRLGVAWSAEPATTAVAAAVGSGG